MLAGTGFMFVLMYEEVEADDVIKMTKLIYEVIADILLTRDRGYLVTQISYCKINDLTCVIYGSKGISYVKS
jgi:hypothetical protein